MRTASPQDLIKVDFSPAAILNHEYLTTASKAVCLCQLDHYISLHNPWLSPPYTTILRVFLIESSTSAHAHAHTSFGSSTGLEANGCALGNLPAGRQEPSKPNTKCWPGAIRSADLPNLAEKRGTGTGTTCMSAEHSDAVLVSAWPTALVSAAEIQVHCFGENDFRTK